MRLARALAWIAALMLVGCQSPPGPFQLLSTSGSLDGPLASLEAGVGEVEFTPPDGAGYPLGGYGTGPRRREWPLLHGGGWPGRLSLDLHQWWHGDAPAVEHRADFFEPAHGTHDGLYARALVVRGAGPPLALVRFDGVVGSEALHARVVELVGDLGFPPEAVVVAATHTHSGLGCYHPARFARLAALDNYRPEVFERLARACADAIRAADAARRPAALGWGTARDAGPDGRPQVAENRRALDFPEVDPDAVDPEVGLLKVVAREGGETIACLVHFAVHPTVLREENLYFSGDLAAAIERAVSDRLPGRPPVLFFNGAEGDVGPRGGRGGGLRRCAELAGRLADVVVPALEAIDCRATRGALRAARGRQEFGEPFLFFALGGRQAFLEADRNLATRLLMAPLTLPLNLLLWSVADNGRLALNWNLTLGFRFSMASYSEETSFPFHALRLRSDAGDLLWVTVPGEAFHDLGLRVKEAARAGGIDAPFFLGLANGALMYMAPPAEYYRGGYEAMVTLFGPETAPRAEAALRGCLDAVGVPVGARPLVAPE